MNEVALNALEPSTQTINAIKSSLSESVGNPSLDKISDVTAAAAKVYKGTEVDIDKLTNVNKVVLDQISGMAKSFSVANNLGKLPPQPEHN